MVAQDHLPQGRSVPTAFQVVHCWLGWLLDVGWTGLPLEHTYIYRVLLREEHFDGCSLDAQPLLDVCWELMTAGGVNSYWEGIRARCGQGYQPRLK